MGNVVSCARINNQAQIKCWGKNTGGVLGPQVQLGGNTLHTDLSTLGVLDLGTNVVVEEIAVGSGHEQEFACVRLHTGQVKCWGGNHLGQLGLGDKQNRGTQASHMGDNLPFVDLGTNRTARQISSGESFTCALLDNWKVKCWGRNDLGQLGSNQYTDDRGDGPGEMGDNLAFVEFPAPFQNMKVVEVRVGIAHATARLQNGQLCFWGDNRWEQLGTSSQSPFYSRTPICPSMFGLFAQEVSSGNYHTCAVLSTSQEHSTTGELHCWGASPKRECGVVANIVPAQNSTHWAASIMEVSLPAYLHAGFYHTCVRFDRAGVKCWGENFEISNSGREHALNLGSGRSVKVLHCGLFHCCARLENDELKCWGANHEGRLGWTSQTTWAGVTGTETGDSLPVVKFNDCASLKCGLNAVWLVNKL